MTPRENAIAQLRRDANSNATEFVVRIGCIPIILLICGIWFTLVNGITTGGMIFVGITGGIVLYLIYVGRGGRFTLLNTIEALAAVEPFYTAYREGQTLITEETLKNSAKCHELRERYYQLKGAVETNINFHKERRQNLLNRGLNQEAHGETMILLDYEDAEKQLQKELAILERGYQPIQTPQVIADPPPVARTKPTRETGLEDY